MERILVLVHGSGPQKATMEFACSIADLTQSKLTGLFIEPGCRKDLQASIICQSRHKEGVICLPGKERLAQKAESKLSFQRFCDNHQLKYSPDMIEVKTPADVYLQTRFADLLIITADAEVVSDDGDIPSEFATEVLKHSECAVFVAPLTYRKMKEIVFTYDGTSSSVFAIKQFTHLFPGLSDLPVTFLEIRSDDADDVNYKQSVTTYLHDHYKNVNQLVLKGRPEDELFSFFLDKQNLGVVMGSFGRKFFSSIFHRSTATLLLQTTGLPVFISHN